MAIEERGTLLGMNRYKIEYTILWSFFCCNSRLSWEVRWNGSDKVGWAFRRRTMDTAKIVMLFARKWGLLSESTKGSTMKKYNDWHHHGKGSGMVWNNSFQWEDGENDATIHTKYIRQLFWMIAIQVMSYSECRLKGEWCIENGQ